MSATFNSQSIDGGSITGYDTDGNAVNVQLALGPDRHRLSWQLFYQSNSSATGTQAAWQNVGTTFTFNANGELTPPLSGLTLQNLTVNGDSLGNVQLNLRHQRSYPIRQFDRRGAGQPLAAEWLRRRPIASIAVDSENQITGTFSNGQTIPLADISLATFNGQDSLQALNGGAYAQTAEFRSADLGRDRHHRRQLAGILERRYLHPIQ